MIELGWRVKGPWQLFMGPASASREESIRTLADNVITKDAFRCQCCGLASHKTELQPTGFLEIRPINNDYDDRSMEKWQTVCTFCHAQTVLIHSLESRKYKLIAAPWLTQSSLNAVLWPLFAVLNDHHQTNYSDALEAYKVFEKQQLAVGTLIGCLPTHNKTPQDNILDFLRAINLSMEHDQYDRRQRFLGGLRLLPVASYFAEQSSFYHEYRLGLTNQLKN